MSTRLKGLLVALPITAIAVAIVVISGATASSPSYAVKGHAVSPQLKRMFGVLRSNNARTAGNQALPPDVSLAMANNSSAEMNPSAAVYAGGNYPTWVVPGKSQVCLVVGPVSTEDVPSSVCAPISDAGERGLAETDGKIVVGLAPNGNSSVKVTDVDGATGSAPIVNNVYEITTGKPSSITLKSSSGASVTRHVAAP